MGENAILTNNTAQHRQPDQHNNQQARIEQELQSIISKSGTKIWDRNLGQKFGTEIWDRNLGQTDGQTDRRTDRTVYRVALQLKIYRHTS
jgi:hypothetical protein